MTDPKDFFEYVGTVYVRHAGRGIFLLDLPRESPDESPATPVELDLEPGHYRAELRFVRVPSPPEDTTR